MPVLGQLGQESQIFNMHWTKRENWPGTHFKLRPFSAGPMTERLVISGYLARRPEAIQIAYQVEGALDFISWPGTSKVKGRCHKLWQQTCFEIFFGVKGEPAYWEVNISPNDCWNVYHFTAYRTGMQEEKSVCHPFFSAVVDGDSFCLKFSMDIKSLIDDLSDLEVGVSSILQAPDGSKSYWAIDHHGTEPDFHSRPSFCLVLPGIKKSNNE